MLKNDWTDAWEAPGQPDPLPMPLQMMVAIEGVSRGHAYPEEAKDVDFNPCGQVIGRATSVRRTKDVVFGMVEEYIDAVEKLQQVERGRHSLTVRRVPARGWHDASGPEEAICVSVGSWRVRFPVRPLEGVRAGDDEELPDS